MFIAGKFFGLAGTLVVNTIFMGIGVFAALAYVSHHFESSDFGILVALYFIILQFVVITALALLFSSFSTPIFAPIFAFWLFVIGNFAQDLRTFAAMAHGTTRVLATAAAYLVPNFSALNVISQVAHGEPVPHRLILLNTAYVLVYSAAVLSGAVMIFERRNLK